MARKKVEICGVNTSSLPLLSEEEKEDLFERIEQGDLLAREHYIKGNLRLVLSIIQRFSGSNENADDLFQVGCIGLMKAIDNFDRNLNVKFSTYAVPMIIGEVKRYLRDNHSMRVSRSLRDTAYKAINAREVLTKKLNHEPTIDVIAKEIDMKKEDVLFALDAIATPLSLYEPVYQDGGDTLYLMDQVKDKKNKEDSWVESIALKEAMEHLCSIGTVVYLKQNLRPLERRLRNLKGRGVVLKPGQTLADLYKERVALYEKYADVTVDQYKQNVDQTLKAVLQALKSFDGTEKAKTE